MDKRAVRENLLSSLEGDGKLLAHQCTSCGAVIFPRESEICLNCLHDELTEIELSGRGALHSWSECAVRSRNFKGPYTGGFVDLDEGPRIFAVMDEDDDATSLSVGTRVQLVVSEVWQTEEESVIGYRFKPTDSGD